MKISIEFAPGNGSAGQHMEMEGDAFFCAAYSQEHGSGIRAKTSMMGSATAAGAAFVLRDVAKSMMKELALNRTARAMFVATMIGGLLEAAGDG